jgi:hypothetical protein
MLATNFRTSGATRKMVGKAAAKPNPHAFIHFITKSETNPILNAVMTKDIIQDINNAIKKDIKYCAYLLGNIIVYPQNIIRNFLDATQQRFGLFQLVRLTALFSKERY